VEGAAAFLEAPVPMAVAAVHGGVLGEVLVANRALCALFGIGEAGLVGRQVRDLVHPEDAEVLTGPLTDLVSGSRQLRIVRANWGSVWTTAALSLLPAGGDGLDGSAVIALQDVTMWREMEAELAHRASHDALTGLANRSLLMDHLDRVMARLARRSGTVAVLFCDLDGFKALNDTFGHRVGDTALQEVAHRILGAVRREDVVVRMGGDEFVIVCEALDSSEASHVADRVREALDAPVRVGGRDFTVSVSIGVAQVTESSGNPEDLVRRADLAMYRAKKLGRNRVEFFAPEMEDAARTRVEIVERVRAGLNQGHVGVDVQPVISFRTGAWIGSEALGRIRPPDERVLLPPQFLDAAANAGLLTKFDAQVRELALGWLAAMGASGGNQPHWVSVNVSVRDLMTVRFAATVEERLRAHGLVPSQLNFELGESEMIDAAGAALATLRRLRTLGCHVTMDDFGSGYSSLTSLRDLPVDFVKIDRSFVAGLGHDSDDEAIVAAIIAVGHQLDRLVIAEGVETPIQSEVLKAMGCDLGQGHLFGAPNPVVGRPQPG
jgi:diguanylate cyclase (GGDEF)-like protein/PAS domain S-box-containing protein